MMKNLTSDSSSTAVELLESQDPESFRRQMLRGADLQQQFANKELTLSPAHPNTGRASHSPPRKTEEESPSVSRRLSGDQCDNHSTRSTSSSGSGFHSANDGHEEEEQEINGFFDGDQDSTDNRAVNDADGHDEDDEEPRSRGTSVTTDNESQYIDIDDVLNFLSPSPRKLPVILKRKGNRTTVVNVDNNDDENDEVAHPQHGSAMGVMESKARRMGQEPPASSPITPHSPDTQKRQPPNNRQSLEENNQQQQQRRRPGEDDSDDDDVLRHATELSALVVDVGDSDAASRVSDDLSGPTLLLMEEEEEEDNDDEQGSVDTMSSHARDIDAEEDAAKTGEQRRVAPTHSPTLPLHKTMGSKDGDGGDTDGNVATAPPSPDGPDSSDGNWDFTTTTTTARGGGLLRIQIEAEEEPTPVASNRAVTVIHPGSIAADLDRLSAPLISIVDEDDSDGDADMEPLRGSYDAHRLRPTTQDPYSDMRGEFPGREIVGTADPHPSFDTNLSDSQHAVDDTHASSTLELALALLEDDDDSDNDDDRSRLGESVRGQRMKDSSAARGESLDCAAPGGSVVQHGEDVDVLDRSAYEEALSLLASDSGEVEMSFHERSADSAAAESLRNRRSDHKAEDEIALDCKASHGNHLMSNEPNCDATDESDLRRSRPQHEALPGDSRAPLLWRLSLNRLKEATMTTLGTATRAFGPDVVGGARGIAESFREAEPIPKLLSITAPPDSTSSLIPFLGTDGSIDPSMGRLANAATSTCGAVLRASTSAVSDVIDFVECVAVTNEVSAPVLPEYSKTSSPGVVSSTSVGTARLKSVGCAPSEEHKSALDQASQLGLTGGGIMNESLSRLVLVASSTASTFVDVSAPVLQDARDFASSFAAMPTDPRNAGTILLQQKKGSHVSESECARARQAEAYAASDRSIRRFSSAALSAAATAMQVGRPALEDASDLLATIVSNADSSTPQSQAHAGPPNEGPDAASTNRSDSIDELGSAISRLAAVTASTVIESTKSLPAFVDDVGQVVGTLLNDTQVVGGATPRRTTAEGLSVTATADPAMPISRSSTFQGPGPTTSEPVTEPVNSEAASAVFRRRNDVDHPAPRIGNESATRLFQSNDLRNTSRSQPSRPPLFPRKSPTGKANEERLFEMVVSKLSSRSLSASEKAWTTQKQSVFAEYNDASLSPPGSPPVPATPSELNDDDSLSLDGSGSVLDLPLANVAPDDDNASAREHSPCQLSQGAIDWGMGSFSSAKSELGVSTRHSTSSRRRGPGRRFSLSSRGSGRSSRSRTMPKSKQQSFRLEARVIPHSLSEDALFMELHDDHSETVSTGIRSSSPEVFERDATSLASTQKHQSTPDLQLLGKRAQAATREKKMSLTASSSPSRLRRNRMLLSPVSPREFPAIQQDVEGLRTMSLPLQEDDLLEEALMKFSSLPSLEFAFIEGCDGSNAEANLAWGRLLACWRHRAVAKSLGSIKEAWDHDAMSEPNSSSMSLPRREDSEEPTLRLGGSSSIDQLATSRNDANRLAYLAVLRNDSRPCDGRGARTVLRHDIQGTERTMSTLIDRSRCNLPSFTCLIKTIAARSLLVGGGITPADSPGRWCSCGLKEPDAIGRKAKRKYAGDVLQVKDVLRARIIFPDEGSLATGLVLLKRLSDESGDAAFPFTIVRVKNSMADSDPFSSLPTGYLHVLVNIRLSDGLLAEIQFNLAPVFDVLGEDGYRLHQELCSRDAELSTRTAAVVAALMQHKPPLVHLTTLDTALPNVASYAESAERLGDANANEKLSTLHESGGSSESSSPGPDESLGSTASGPTEGAPVQACSEPSNPTIQAGDVCKEADFVVELLKHGCRAAADNPRDIPSLVCLVGLLVHLLEDDRYEKVSPSHNLLLDKDGLIEAASRCTLRCLAISSQATTLGMTGWLEYGSDAPFNRSTRLPYTLLYDLAVCHARAGRWNSVVEVLQSNVAWCEGHDDPFHARTMVALLDLSASFWNCAMPDAAASVLATFHRRASSHFAAMEASCFEQLNMQVIESGNLMPTFRLESAPAPLATMEMFCRTLHELLNRRFVSVLGRGHPAVAHHRRVLGDAYAVLANCTSAAEGLHASEIGSECPSSVSPMYWRMASDQYASVLNDPNGSRSLGDTSEASTPYVMAHRMARCLHGLGKGPDALELLLSALADVESNRNPTEALAAGNDKEESLLGGPTFLPMPHTSPSTSWNALQAKASCYWLAAVLSTEPMLVHSPSSSESSRTAGSSYSTGTNASLLEQWSRAMSFLRCASQCYRAAIELLLRQGDDDPSVMTAVSDVASQLETVENEARLLLHALRHGPMSASAQRHRSVAGSRGPRGAAPSPYSSSPLLPTLAWS